MRRLSSLCCLSTILTVFSINNLYAQGDVTDRFSPAPTITIGGFINSSAAFRSEEGDFGNERLPDATVTAGVVDNATGTHNKMTNDPDFTNEAEIHIKVAGINEFGMKYGGVIELEANTTTSARNEGFNADKVYIFTESRMGKMEFGNNMAVNQKMKVGPETFARGAGGINGKYIEYINFPMLANSTQLSSGEVCTGGATDAACDNVKLPSFIMIPQSPVAHGGYARSFYNTTTDDDYANGSADDVFGFNKNKDTVGIRNGSFGDLEDATKISYYTPRMSGWQFGTSFTPDTGNNGTSATISGDNSGDIKQLVSYGLNYSNSFGNLGFAMSLTGESGQFEQVSSATIQREDLQAYELGLMATYSGFTVGASYGNWGNSLQATSGIYSCDYDEALTFANQTCASSSTAFDDSTYYTAGAAYQFGPVATSVTYLSSDFQENQYNALSIGFDYRMAKGLMPYLEVTKFEFESNQVVASDIADQATLSNDARQLKDNSGYIILTGLLFSF